LNAQLENLLTLVEGGMNSTQVLQYLYLQALAEKTSADFFIDYKKVSLLLEQQKQQTSFSSQIAP